MNDLAHDLAITKLSGSNLPVKEMLTKYYEYLHEFQAEISSHNDKKAETKVMDRRSLGI